MPNLCVLDTVNIAFGKVLVAYKDVPCVCQHIVDNLVEHLPTDFGMTKLVKIDKGQRLVPMFSSLHEIMQQPCGRFGVGFCFCCYVENVN